MNSVHKDLNQSVQIRVKTYSYYLQSNWTKGITYKWNKRKYWYFSTWARNLYYWSDLKWNEN